MNVDNSFTEKENNEVKKILYGRIDFGLSISFLGGVILGIIPYFFTVLKSPEGACVFFGVISFFLYFFARYLSLKFLFPNKENSSWV